jgi:hypothetical protein
MKPDDLQRELSRAHARFMSTTHITAGGREVPLSNWAWPNPKQVQGMLQRCIMQALTDPNGHFHEEPFEVHVDAVATSEITSVQAQFPPEFQKVMLVAYKPNQQWVEPNKVSTVVKF